MVNENAYKGFVEQQDRPTNPNALYEKSVKDSYNDKSQRLLATV